MPRSVPTLLDPNGPGPVPNRKPRRGRGAGQVSHLPRVEELAEGTLLIDRRAIAAALQCTVRTLERLDAAGLLPSPVARQGRTLLWPADQLPAIRDVLGRRGRLHGVQKVARATTTVSAASAAKEVSPEVAHLLANLPPGERVIRINRRSVVTVRRPF